MKISFDGLRRNIAEDFNHLVLNMNLIEDDNKPYYAQLVNQLRGSLGALMSCYDSEQMPDDFNDLSDLKLEGL